MTTPTMTDLHPVGFLYPTDRGTSVRCICLLPATPGNTEIIVTQVTAQSAGSSSMGESEVCVIGLFERMSVLWVLSAIVIALIIDVLHPQVLPTVRK